jgi:hypothetical protein
MLLYHRIHSNSYCNKSIVTSAPIVTRRGNVLFSLLSDNCRRVSEETPNMLHYLLRGLTNHITLLTLIFQTDVLSRVDLLSENGMNKIWVDSTYYSDRFLFILYGILTYQKVASATS